MQSPSYGKLFLYAALSFTLLLPVSAAEISDNVTVGGWIRADYGQGNRYPEASGEDTLGISQAALLGKWSKDNVEAVLLLGGTNLTADDSDGDIGIKDAFVVWKEVGGSALSLSVGAQPLLFGLKPNGFPGDRSLQPSIEYGGAGGFAVSQQAGPSVIASIPTGRWFSFRGGLFDTSSSTAAYFQQTGLGDIDGSSLTKNYFLQVNFGVPEDGVGLYGVVGYEGRYVGGAVDATEPIFDFGLGLRHHRFDISVEAILLDLSFTGTADDEVYTIAELTLMPTDRLSFHLDYASASEADVQTIRVGLTFSILENFNFRLEYSDDDFGAAGSGIDSFDSRLEFYF